MYLTAKDYVAPEKPKRIIPDVKAKIKNFVGSGKESYENIVIEIQKTKRMTNDEIIDQIKEIDLEWYPKEIEIEEV